MMEKKKTKTDFGNVKGIPVIRGAFMQGGVIIKLYDKEMFQNLLA